MDYNFREIEKKWQSYWKGNSTYRVDIDESREKFYVLDMFPYPSGSGLHVGHPLGYIASDIYARYKTHRGYNVLHPMGYDAFGLPAEQYAIQTGTHPAVTTEKNIKRYREQLDNIGFSFDWSREVRTNDPDYYKWTQWTFLKLFSHYYDKEKDKATPIDELITAFETSGSEAVNASHNEHSSFSSQEWKKMSEKQKSDILMCYRLAYLSEALVNWCPKLGTVLANDEVADGLSVRGGYPVERKKMKQWSLRITAYAERLLDGLKKIDWPEPLKDIQSNWIGKSEGVSIFFDIENSDDVIEVFTTRSDTIYGSTFMVLAPEHELAEKIAGKEKKQDVINYINWAKNRSDVVRMADKKITGQDTGAFAINPFSKKKMPIYIADYVLIGYGTGAVMAVPGHDGRDFLFARHFNLPIEQVVKNPEGKIIPVEEWENAYEEKEGIMMNSGFMDGMTVKQAIEKSIEVIEEKGLGKRQVNFRLRDAIFSRQRYWGEPIPIYYENGIPTALSYEKLPLKLPEIDNYNPTPDGNPPLARLQNWKTSEGHPYETTTMPGFAGSSAYYLRYLDPENDKELCSKKAVNYWKNVDLYIGGREHATGHLIYARFWNKFLYDIGISIEDEPFKKLINQGMIQGRSNFVYRIKGTNKFVSHDIKEKYETQKIHVDVNIVENDILDIEKFKQSNPDYKNAEIITGKEQKYICGWEIEKMSKSLLNVVNPDDLVEKYGADTLRMYEMFLGPIEQAKPWDTNGIEGVYRFLRKFWRIFHDENGNPIISEEKPNEKELKILHGTIKKVTADIEKFSFNTGVSNLMICLNEIGNCNKREVLETLTILISPYAPHFAEEMWAQAGHKDSVTKQKWPEYDEKFLIAGTITYPVSFNGKMRFKMDLPAGIAKEEAEKAVIENENAKKWIEGKQIVKLIFVPGKIINVVVK